MDEKQMLSLAEQFLGAWNTQDVERVVECYTEDLLYRDPNTRGFVEGRAAMRRYLTKLFGHWRMHWTLREAHLFATREGCAVAWHARLEHDASGLVAEVDGLDLVIVRDDRIARNEVYFDRAALAAQASG